MKNQRYISFDNGVIVSVPYDHVMTPAEIEDRCENVYRGCSILDSDFKVTGVCKFNGNKYVFENS
jgi:hypothetical protein